MDTKVAATALTSTLRSVMACLTQATVEVETRLVYESVAGPAG